jgi:hypothetical protein
VVDPDSLERVLLDAAAWALQERCRDGVDRVPVPDGRPDLLDPQGRDGCAGGSVLAEDAGRIDAESVAEWIISRYPAGTYPAVVLGSPHGAAVHLAADLGGPWLPTSFPVRVPWDGAAEDWRGACAAGAAVVDRIVTANPEVTVRQVHDPVRNGHLCGSTLTLHVRWRRLPCAYRDFLHDRLAAGARSLFLRDVRTWPVLHRTPEHSFQVGSPVSGRRPYDYMTDDQIFADFMCSIGHAWLRPHVALPHRYAESAGEPQLEAELRQVSATTARRTHRVLYPNPETLSACVADLYRDCLAGDERGPQQCVVEIERLLDPRRVLTSRTVPYWCESDSRHAVSAAEWWLAGSRPFDHVDVLPTQRQPSCGTYADLRQRRALTSFARHRRDADQKSADADPVSPEPNGRAATAPPRAGTPPRMGLDQVLRGLRLTGQTSGLLVI